LTERPQNIRFAGTLERTHNSRRLRAESRSAEARTSARSYRGSHRAEHTHRTEHTYRAEYLRRTEHLHRPDGAASAAYDRNSRVGGHHSGRQTDRSNCR
jgi:hypothetical protein